MSILYSKWMRLQSNYELQRNWVSNESRSTDSISAVAGFRVYLETQSSFLMHQAIENCIFGPVHQFFLFILLS